MSKKPKHTVQILRGDDNIERSRIDSSQHDGNPETSGILKPKYTHRCKYCKREVEITAPVNKINGRVYLLFKCNRHGSLQPGEVLFGMEA